MPCGHLAAGVVTLDPLGLQVADAVGIGPWSVVDAYDLRMNAERLRGPFVAASQAGQDLDPLAAFEGHSSILL